MEAERDRLRMAADQGTRVVTVIDRAEPADIHRLIEDRASAAKKLEAKTQEREVSIRRKYAVHKWAFVAGLCLLMGARASVPLVQVIDGLQKKSSPPTPAIAASGPSPAASARTP